MKMRGPTVMLSQISLLAYSCAIRSAHPAQAGKAECDRDVLREDDFEGRMEGYGTNHDTKSLPDLTIVPQIIDSLVELSGIEPLTSSLRTRRSPS
jgi:hypothetical protein